MLRLTRKVGERIVVGDDEVIIELCEIDHGRNNARIGVIAPNHEVYREEIIEERERTGDRSGEERDQVLARSRLALRIARAIQKERPQSLVDAAKLIEGMLPDFT